MKKNNYNFIKNSAFFKFITLVVMVLVSIFYLRLAFTADFTNVVEDESYFEYNVNDNQLTNLDDIYVSSYGLFNFIRSEENYFGRTVERLMKFNIFTVAAESLNDVWLIGPFLNFLAEVFAIVVYVVSIVVSAFWYLIDILKYIFTGENFVVNNIVVSISDVG